MLRGERVSAQLSEGNSCDSMGDTLLAVHLLGAGTDAGLPMLTSPKVELEVLGPLRIVVDGNEVSVGGGKLAGLLVALLTRPNEVASVDWLAHVLWNGSKAPSNPRGTIQTYVRRLRSVVGDCTVRSSPGGYSIVVGPDSYDLARFRALVAKARIAENTGQPAAAAVHLTDALKLWRGPAFAGLESDALRRDEIPEFRTSG